MNYKGQGATEYLTIFAIILIIVLIVISVFTWIPSYSVEMVENLSKVYWQDAHPIAITDWIIDENGISFELMNKTTKKLIIDDIFVENEDLNITLDLPPGKKVITPKSDALKCNTPGESYLYSVEFIYHYPRGISGKRQLGLKPIVGRCS